MKKNVSKDSPKVLGLDISTKTIGVALFDIETKQLLELTHISPKPKLDDENKMKELLLKSFIFRQKLETYVGLGIQKVIIEEPLLNSNNIYTVGTLLRYNTLILKNCYDILGILPTFISTYNARKFAFPNLVGKNDKGKNVLFGGLPKNIDKKHIIWEHVNSLFPEIKWLYDKNGKLKKENYDMADSVATVLGFVNMNLNTYKKK